jgi:hypothetical protein
LRIDHEQRRGVVDLTGLDRHLDAVGAWPSIALASSIAVVVRGQTVVHSESLKANSTSSPR